MIKDKRPIFAKEPVNTCRQPEMDSIRMMFLFMVAAIHCTIECTSEEGLCSGLPYVFDTIIGGPLAAPPLMFLMGMCMVYARKHDFVTSVQRAANLFIAGFLLNICRFTIPYLIGYAISGDTQKYIQPLLYKTFCNDIFQFAGMAFFFIALLIRLKVPDMGMLAIGLVCSLAGTLLNGTDVGTPFGNIVLGYFIGTEDAAGYVISDFVFLNWIIVPIAGYIFGKCLRYVQNKSRFYLTISPACAVIALIYFIWGISSSYGMFGEGENCYYHVILPDALICIVVSIALLGIHHAVNSRLSEQGIRIIHRLGTDMTLVYVIHWVLISVSINVVLYLVRGTQLLPMYYVLFIAAAITVVSVLIAELWKRKLKDKIKEWI